MSAKEADVEALVRARLGERGWGITAETRRGIDVDWQVEREGAVATVRLRSPYATFPQVPDAVLPPAFVRIDRGAVDDQVQAWAVTPGKSDGEDDPDIGHQTVAGTDWASAAIGVGACATREQWRAAVDALLDAVQDQSVASEPVRVEPDPDGTNPWLPLLYFGLVMVAFIGFARMYDVEGAVFLAVLASLISAALAIGALRKWLQRRATRVDAPSSVAALRSPPFVIVDDRTEPCGRVAVITRAGSALATGHAQVNRRTLKARLEPRGASITLTIWACRYPDGTIAECQLVPDWTSVVGLDAPAELLAQLPPESWPSQPGKGASWLLHDDASLAELLERITRVLRRASL